MALFHIRPLTNSNIHYYFADPDPQELGEEVNDLDIEDDQPALQHRSSCSKKKQATKGCYFMGHDSRVLRLMPDFITTQLPVVFTKKGAVENPTLDLLHVAAGDDSDACGMRTMRSQAS
jgi:hypothetical protein